MYGYLKPFIPELKIKDYDTYLATEFGLQNMLSKQYGHIASKMMGSDMILFAILCDSLAGREGTYFRKHNPQRWFRRCDMLSHTQGVRLAAKMQMILSVHKIMGLQKMTQKSSQRFFLSMIEKMIARSYQKALEDEGSDIERLLLQEADHEKALVMAKCTNYELACAPSGNVFSALFLRGASDEASWRPLQHFGYQIGCIYYFFRVVDEYDMDKENGRYNIFIANGLSKANAIEAAKRQCNMAAVELAKAAALLNLKLNRSLIDNIIYLGLEHAVEQLGQTEQKKVRKYR